ncbi:hypothetical protein HYH02_011587 [Chlamydomonas schloesseri]|uniref:Uncharacterized protein n=1 Tax=Chlamydomonas schloesseri TaxID=2026947 RepID=A0A835W526_9CHLO|nr:hypothetical protein HYH02_011587 [Chlamydomonas schloesseri]|eukprot:KAG2436076.1 hypothetical protein HYH02_011587 [Chlamydomonas schloesseri]
MWQHNITISPGSCNLACTAPVTVRLGAQLTSCLGLPVAGAPYTLAGVVTVAATDRSSDLLNVATVTDDWGLTFVQVPALLITASIHDVQQSHNGGLVRCEDCGVVAIGDSSVYNIGEASSPVYGDVYNVMQNYAPGRQFGTGVFLITSQILALVNLRCSGVSNALGFACVLHDYTPSPGGTMVIEGSTFEDNSVNYGVYGYGAVVMFPKGGPPSPCTNCDATLGIKNSKFLRNYGGCGGALAVLSFTGGPIYVSAQSGTELNGNKANVAGGAVYLRHTYNSLPASRAYLELVGGSTMNSNEATFQWGWGRGGGVASDVPWTALAIKEGSQMNSNVAVVGGAAYTRYSYEQIAILSGSHVELNASLQVYAGSALSRNRALGSSGGALCAGGAIGSIDISQGYIDTNTADGAHGSGGAIYAQGQAIGTIRAELDAAGMTTATEMRAALDAGIAAIVAGVSALPASVTSQPDVATLLSVVQAQYTGIGSVALSDGYIRDNTRGAIYTPGNVLSVTVSGSQVAGNSANGNTEAAGGFLFTGGVLGQLSVSSTSSITDNRATSAGGRGGAIAAVTGISRLIMSNAPAALAANQAVYGGAVWTGGSVLQMALTDSGMNGNYGERSGGAVHAGLNIYSLRLANSQLVSNYAANNANGYGGAIYAAGFLGELVLGSGSNVRGSSCGARGGAVYVGGGISAITLSDASYIGSNTAGTDGGAIFTTAVQSLDLSGGAYAGLNTASTGFGGFLAANTDVGTITLTGASKLEKNSAGTDGGAVAVKGDLGSVSLVAGSSVSLNTAGSGAGGFLYTGGVLGSLTLTGGSSVVGNMAGTSGAGVYVGGKPLASDAAAQAAIDAALAAIPAELAALPEMTALAATVRAGSVGLGSISLEGSSMADNWAGRVPGAAAASYGGGAICSGGHVQSVQLAAGSAMRKDGVAALTLMGACSMSGSVAGKSGGALYAGGFLGPFSLSGASAVSANSAGTSGGALFVGITAASVTVEGTSTRLSANVAALGDGGAVAVGTAAGSGGLLGPVVIRDGAEVSDNQAGRSGGAFFAAGYSLAALPSLQGPLSASVAAVPADVASIPDVASVLGTISSGKVGVPSLAISNGSRLHRNRAGTVPVQVSGGGASSGGTGGGGVVSSGGHIGSVTISQGSEVVNCSAGGSGGVVFADGVVGALTITDTAGGSLLGVSGCSAGLNGGVVFARDGVMSVALNNTLVAACSAVTGSGGVLHTGGLLPVLDLSNSALVNNSAATRGGAVTADVLMGAVTLRGASNVTGNAAVGATAGSGDGGALYSGSLIANLSVTGASQLSRNRAGRHGGAVYAVGLNLTQLPAALAAITAAVTTALPADLASLTDVADVVAAIPQGSIGVGAFSLEPGSAISGNVALVGSGGAIAAGGHFPSLTFVPGMDMSGNVAGSHGGAIWCSGILLDVAILSSSSLAGNVAQTGGGGALHSALGFATVVVADGTSLHGCSGGSGGALYAGRLLGSLLVSNRSSIANNRATSGPGGGVYAGLIGSLKVTEGSEVSGNSASSGLLPAAAGDGGGVYSAGFIGAFELSHGSSVQGNQARRHGGGIYAAGTPLQRVPAVAAAINTTLLSVMGGAATAGASAQLQSLTSSVVSGSLGFGSILITNSSSITSNTAGTDVGVGGGIGSGGQVGSLQLLSGSSIASNRARHGAGIGAAGILVNITIDSSSLRGNVALNGSGGGLLGQAILLLRARNSALRDNAADVGGLLCSYTVTYGLDISACEVSGNTAESFGGVAYSGLAHMNVSLSSVQVLRNRAHPEPVVDVPDAGTQYIYMFRQICQMINSLAASPTAPPGFNVPPECGSADLGNLRTVSAAFLPAIEMMIRYMSLNPDQPLWSGKNITGGGGVFFTWGNIVTLVATSTLFDDNTAARFGGVFGCTGAVNSLELSHGTTIRAATARWIGGALLAFREVADLSIHDDTLVTQCYARWGGAVASLLGFERLSIRDRSRLAGNRAESTGGAILSGWTGYINNLLISNSSGLWDNYAGSSSSPSSGTEGGAILMDGDLVNATIQFNSSIHGNNATESGGGLEVRGVVRNFTCQFNCSVRNNRANFGGGMYVKQGVYGMAFLHNSGLHNNSALESYGGGLLVMAGGSGSGELNDFVLRDNSHVRFNSAGREGGGIDVRGGWPARPRITGLTVEGGSSFTGNSAFELGGGIHASGDISAVVISGNSGFWDNTANLAGGGIYCNGSFYSVQMLSNAAMTNNSAGDGGGGAVAVGGDMRAVRLSGASTISSNRAAFYGGAFRVNGSVESLEVVEQSRVLGNSVNGAGGFLWAGGDVAILSVAQGSSLSGNSASGQGGCVCAAGVLSRVEVAQSSVVSENTAAEGGAFYALAGVAGMGVTSGSSVTRNRAGSGGFLGANGTISALSFTEGAAVTENGAAEGGVVWSASGINDLAVQGGVGVWRNEAQERGGFAHSGADISGVLLAASQIYSNRAGAGGGVLSAAGALRNLTLASAVNVHDNAATGRMASGGVVAAGDIADVQLGGGATVWGNTATGAGGAFHCTQTMRRFNVSGGAQLFANAAGAAGGVLHCGDEVTNLTITGAASVTGNRARDGGVVACGGRATGMRIEGGSDVSANTASERAGAVFAGDLHLTLTGRSRLRGHAANWGGSIYVQGTLQGLVISGNSSLSSSKAVDLGGAVYIFGTTSNSTAATNTSTAGAELYGNGSNVWITQGSSVSDVSAGSSGGFLYSYVGDISSFVVSDGSVVRNLTSARGSGGLLSTGGGLGSLRLEGGSRLSAVAAADHGGLAFAALGVGEAVVENNSSISDVHAGTDGGVVATLGAVGRLAVTGASSVQDVRAGGRGGVVFAAAALGDMVISGGSSLRRNSAGLSGGVVHVGGAMQLLELTGGSALDSNTAAGGDGGCVAAASLRQLTVSDSEVLSNRAAGGSFGGEGHGGCISSGNSSDGAALRWSVTRSRLFNNSAKADGGVLFMATKPLTQHSDGGAASPSVLELSGLLAINNSAGGRGGVVAVCGVCSVAAANSSLVASAAGLSGGSIALWDPQAALALSSAAAATAATRRLLQRHHRQLLQPAPQQESHITGVSRTDTAAAVAAPATAAEFVGTALTVAHSSSWQGDGGAVWVYGASHALLVDSTFQHCTAHGDGGAVALVAAAAVGLVRSSIATSRALLGRGGGLSVVGAERVLLAASDVTANVAAQAGGVHVGPMRHSNASATIVAYGIRVNDNTAGRTTAPLGRTSAAYPGFGGGLFIGHHTASVLVSGSDLGGNCAWLGAAVVSLVRRSFNSTQLEAAANATADMAAVVGGAAGGGVRDTSSAINSTQHQPDAAAAAAPAGDVGELLAQLDSMSQDVHYNSADVDAAAGGSFDGSSSSTAAQDSDSAGGSSSSSSSSSSFMFMQNTSMLQPAGANNCSSFLATPDLMPAQRLASSVWVDDLEGHGVFSDSGCTGVDALCLVNSAPAGTGWLEGPPASGSAVLLLNRSGDAVLRPGERFSLHVTLRDAFNSSVSTVLEHGAYNGTLMLLHMDLAGASALLREQPQLLPTRAAALDGTQTLACLADTTVAEFLTDRYNASSRTNNASACSPDKAVAYLAATGEQGLTDSFEEHGLLTWNDLAVRGWPGGNYTIVVLVAGPSAVDPILLPITLDGCRTGEFLETSASSSAAGASSAASNDTTTASGGGGSGSSTGSGASRLALMAQADCAVCPRRQVGQVADPRQAQLAEGTYPAALAALQEGIAAVRAACSECPDNAVVVVPGPGYWHSSPTSLYMVRCPNPDACTAAAEEEAAAGGDGSDPSSAADPSPPAVMRIDSISEALAALSADDARTTQLAVCQQWTYAGGGNSSSSSAAAAPCVLDSVAATMARRRRAQQQDGGTVTAVASYMQQQCAEGYTGNLCGVCQEGWVLTPADFSCSTCPPHASAVTALLALVMLVVAVFNIMTLAVEHFKETAPYEQGDGDDDDNDDGGGDGGGNDASVVDEEQLADAESAGDEGDEGEKEAVGDVDGTPAATGQQGEEEEETEVSLGEIWKMFIAHFQQLLIIWRLNINYPNVISSYVGGMGAATTPLTSFLVYNPSCLLPTHTPAQQARLAYMFALVQPFIAVALTLGVWVAGFWTVRKYFWRWTSKRASTPLEPAKSSDNTSQGSSTLEGEGTPRPNLRLRLGRQLLVVMLTAVFYEYPAWADVALNSFACFIIDADQGPITPAQTAGFKLGYWTYNLNQECYRGEHAGLYVPLGVVVLLLCCVLPPLFTLVSLVRTTPQQRRTDGRTRLMYSFLYKSYKDDYYWYDSMMQLQLLGLVAVSVFGRVLLVEYQALLMLVVLLVFSSINVLARPLRLDEMNSLQFFSSAVLCTTITLSLYFVLGNYLTLSDAGKAAIALVIIALNTLAGLFYLALAVRDIRHMMLDPRRWLRDQWARLQKLTLPLRRRCGCAPREPEGGAPKPRKLRPWQRAWWVDLHTPPPYVAGDDDSVIGGSSGGRSLRGSSGLDATHAGGCEDPSNRLLSSEDPAARRRSMLLQFSLRMSSLFRSTWRGSRGMSHRGDVYPQSPPDPSVCRSSAGGGVPVGDAAAAAAAAAVTAASASAGSAVANDDPVDALPGSNQTHHSSMPRPSLAGNPQEHAPPQQGGGGYESDGSASGGGSGRPLPLPGEPEDARSSPREAALLALPLALAAAPSYRSPQQQPQPDASGHGCDRAPGERPSRADSEAATSAACSIAGGHSTTVSVPLPHSHTLCGAALESGSELAGLIVQEGPSVRGGRRHSQLFPGGGDSTQLPLMPLAALLWHQQQHGEDVTELVRVPSASLALAASPRAPRGPSGQVTPRRMSRQGSYAAPAACSSPRANSFLAPPADVSAAGADTELDNERSSGAASAALPLAGLLPLASPLFHRADTSGTHPPRPASALSSLSRASHAHKPLQAMSPRVSCARVSVSSVKVSVSGSGGLSDYASAVPSGPGAVPEEARDVDADSEAAADAAVGSVETAAYAAPLRTAASGLGAGASRPQLQRVMVPHLSRSRGGSARPATTGALRPTSALPFGPPPPLPPAPPSVHDLATTFLEEVMEEADGSPGAAGAARGLGSSVCVGGV